MDITKQNCTNCGIDLGLALGFITHSYATSQKNEESQALAPEILTPRLGEYLVSKGFISEENLKLALDYQKEQAELETPVLLGQALVIFGLIDREQLDKAVTEQIMILQSALRESNLHLDQMVQERTKELKNALLRLETLNEIKNNFISNVSHELRTPLSHIVGYVDLLEDGAFGDVTDDQKDILQVLQKSTDRLQGLIENLLNFAETSRGSVEIQLVSVSIEDIMNTIDDRIYQKAKENNIRFDLDIPDNRIKVLADKAKIAWVIDQLLDNAVKFNKAKGKVSLAIKNGIDSTRIKISVTDTGIGIPESKLDEIFASFQQVDGSSTRQYGGAGLGLALVKKVLEAHDTVITVQSKEGQGSYFEFSLPVVIS
ncbi:MAG: hypothetical protein JXA19_05215 [Anaerolineales bacterium]|nr:hypothetical protein [Anaerolineales bacterium]